jgi:putative FmdB family regulatory protein
MPLQKFECLSCKSVFEKLIREKKQAIACPACEKSKLRQLPPATYIPLNEDEKRSYLKKTGEAQGIGRKVDKTWDPKKHQEHY